MINNFNKNKNKIRQLQRKEMMHRIEPSELGIHNPQLKQITIKPISWQQFKGEIPNTPKYYAHIYWNIDYKYNFNINENNNEKQRTYTINVIARPYISNKSWVRLDKANDKLLRHQYGHYLIGCICALKFQDRVNCCGVEFQSRNEGIRFCQSMFQETLKEYLDVQIKYDQETDHYYNEEGQQKWQAWIANQINSFNTPLNRKLTKLSSLVENNANIQPGRKHRSVSRNRSNSRDKLMSMGKGSGDNAQDKTMESENSRSKQKSRQLSVGKYSVNDSNQSSGRCCTVGHYNIRIRKTSMSYPPLPPRQPIN